MSCGVVKDKNAYIVPNNPRFDLFSTSNFNGFASLSLTTFDIGVNITGNIRLMPNNTERIRITNGGNVGINNATPNYLLDINGNANFTGSITANNFVGNVISTGYTWKIVKTFISSTQSGGVQWQDVCYGNNIFVAVSYSPDPNNIMISVDGINWKQCSKSGSEALYGVNYVNNIFIATGSNIIYNSIDGINWVKYSNFNTIFGYAWVQIAYGNNIYVCVSNSSGSTYNKALYSYDGVNWFITPTNNTATSNWFDVYYGNNIFVAIGNGTYNVMTSTDGINWTNFNTIIYNSTTVDFRRKGITYANGWFVIVSAVNNVVYKSRDGINWTFSYVYPLTEPIITYGNGYFIILSRGANTIYSLYSNDISNNNWNSGAPFNAYYDTIKSICYGNGMFVGVTQTANTGNVYVSGIQTTTQSSNASWSYTGLYADKSITLYDNTSIARTSSGLQYRSPTVSHIWSLVKNISNSSLSFSSLYGYQFKTNGTSSTNGTFALGISSTGNIQIGNNMTFGTYASNCYPKHYVNGIVCVNGSINIKSNGIFSMSLNIGSYFADPAPYGIIQITNPVNSIDRSSFSFVRYSTSDYWQIGPTYGQNYGLGFYGSAGRFQNTSATPCFTILVNSAGVNKSSTDISNANLSFPYTLDVSGSGRFTSTLQSGNLTCSKITVSNINTWYITNIPGATITIPVNGNIGATSSGFGNVFLNGSTTESSSTFWNKTTATFTAPTTGLYMFNLHVFDTTANTTNRGNCLQICGNGLPNTQPNGGQYLTFGQAYNSTEGAYVITQTLFLTSGQIIYYRNSGSVGLTWFYGKGSTELTITQLC